MSRSERIIQCGRCRGEGAVEGPEVCPVCKGTGRLALDRPARDETASTERDGRTRVERDPEQERRR